MMLRTQDELKRLFRRAEVDICKSDDDDIIYYCATIHLLIADICKLRGLENPYDAHWAEGE
jgi:hypothetical protein